MSKYYEYVLKTLNRVILKDNRESFTEKIQPKETEDNMIIDDDVEENELLEQMSDTLNTKKTLH